VNSRAQAGLLLAVALLAGVAGFAIRHESRVSPEAQGAAQRLMQSTLSDSSGKPQAMEQWRGKVVVVNFWATWCTPCREEIPALMRIQHRYAANGLHLVGIALDNVSKVREYASEMQIDYTLLIGSIDTLDLSKDLGNRAGVLPFTVVLDRSGKLAHAHIGVLTESALSAVLEPLL
jgi:thiol-disulfide isomerase/thioredoxin